MKTLSCLTLLTILLAFGSAEAGVSSKYYLSGNDGHAYVVQGESVINSFEMVNSEPGPIIVVGDNSIVTADNSTIGGGYYDINGIQTGETFTNPSPGIPIERDGATDGTKLYTISILAQDLMMYDRSFSNRQTLKHWSTTLGLRYRGIAYDPTDNTFWLSGNTIAEMHHVDINGDFISSFPIATTSASALALDPADNTLWYNKNGTNEFYQYSKTGIHLDTITVQGLPQQQYSGGDINIVSGPGLIGDLDGDGFVGIDDLNIVLGAWNQSVPPADPAADPSGDGFVGIDDLNTVLSNWNAGTPPSSQVNIPEPTSIGILFIGAAVLTGRVKINRPS